jgi:hypothetical protein
MEKNLEFYPTTDNLPPKETYFICFNEFPKSKNEAINFPEKFTATSFEG